MLARSHETRAPSARAGCGSSGRIVLSGRPMLPMMMKPLAPADILIVQLYTRAGGSPKMQGTEMDLSAASFLALLLVLAAAAAAATAAAHEGDQQQSNIFLWPQPRSIKLGSGPAIPISPSFQIHFSAGELTRAAVRLRRSIFTEGWSPVLPPSPSAWASALPQQVSPLLSLDVSVASPDEDLQHGVDESYTLTVPDSGGTATLSSKTCWGAMRGMETFSQLVVQLSGKGNSSIERGVTIEDWPLLAHRGIMLDTSRNFYPVKDILRTIRAMAHNKLNVFHWHITDSHSFPLALAREPRLAAAGSYGPSATYTAADIRHIVRYARSFGVRVVPEIDAPGHAASWAGAYPEIVTCSGATWWNPSSGQSWNDRMASEPGSGQLNPLVAKTYDVVNNVLDEVAELFPDGMYHAGGDEIVPACWNASSDIATAVSSGATTMGGILSKFIAATQARVTKHNNKTGVVYWEDVLLDAIVNVSAALLPPSETILQTWRSGASSVAATTAAGYRTIVSSSDFLYLDCGHGDFLLNDTRFDQQNSSEAAQPPSIGIVGSDAIFNYGGSGGSWCAPFKTWARIYDLDLTFGLTPEQAALVIGAEAALWSEQSDGSVVDSRLWPRAAALAEMTWSGNRDDKDAAAAPPQQKRTAQAGFRLAQWRERLVTRGITAEPMLPRWCLLNPGMCNLNA